MRKILLLSVLVITVTIASALLGNYYGTNAAPVFKEEVLAEESAEENLVQEATNISEQEAEDALNIIFPKTSNIKISVVGDLMVHDEQMYFAKKSENEIDFNSSFRFIKPYLENADLTVGNLETTFAGKEVGYSFYPTFNAPDEFGQALKNAGFDLVTTTNNHALDKMEKGVLRTLDVLDTLGIDHVGTYRSFNERDNIYIKEIDGIRLAFLSYTYGTNGIPIPQNKEYLINVLNEGLIQADIKRAKELKPDFIIVLPHMGVEYDTLPNSSVKNWVNIMLDAGADIVLASHPHVVQPTEFIEKVDENGEVRTCFVAYSMGNFISSQRTLPRDTGIIVNLEFEKKGRDKAVIKNADVVKTWVKFKNAKGAMDIAVLPVEDTLLQYESGQDIDLRQKDINRIKEIGGR